MDIWDTQVLINILIYFEAKANLGGSENIKAVSFMTGSSTNLNYTVSVYTNLSDDTNPESGTLAA